MKMTLKTPQAVVIGASAGGLHALKTILSAVPASFPGAFLIAQHRKANADDLFSQLLHQVCPLPVLNAQDKAKVTPGHVYVAPANYHLLVEPDRCLSLSIDAPVSYARPSIDVLFETAAEAYRQYLVGVLLTGSNHDGTNGICKIKTFGGLTIAQDPATAEVTTMPQSAIDSGCVDRVLPLTEIADDLVNIFIQDPVPQTG